MPQLTTALLNELITIEGLSGSGVDDRGLSNETWSASASNVQARVVDSSNITETQNDGIISNVERKTVVIPAGTSVSVRNRVKIGTDYYNIIKVEDVKDRSGNVFYKRITISSGF